MRYKQLSINEREIIAQMIRHQTHVREIARQLGRSPSTVSRELMRNQDSGRYYPYRAEANYHRRRMNCRRRKLYQDRHLLDFVTRGLMCTWSPEEIAGRLGLEYPDTPTMRASCSSIYRWLNTEKLPQASMLKTKLRHYGKDHNDPRGKLQGIRDLNTRAREVFRRKRFGDWEADTIVSPTGGRGGILNISERRSRACFLVLLKTLTAKEVMRGFEVVFSDHQLPLATITSDRGKEFSCFKEFENTFHRPFYLARPASPWQKPTVENANGLLRQFFPKGTNFREVSPEAVGEVMAILNNRPRKCLAWKTPSEVLASSLP